MLLEKSLLGAPVTVITQLIFASEMTYIVSGGALNSTHSLTNWACTLNCVFDQWTRPNPPTKIKQFCDSTQAKLTNPTRGFIPDSSNTVPYHFLGANQFHENAVASSQIFRLKCTKSNFGWGTSWRSVQFISVCTFISHTRTVVRECFKGGVSEWVEFNAPLDTI